MANAVFAIIWFLRSGLSTLIDLRSSGAIGFEAVGVFENLPIFLSKGRGLTRRPFDSCGRDCGSGGGFDNMGFSAEDGTGDESNDKADGQGLHEGVGHVDEGVLVELLRTLYGGDLRGSGGGVKAGGLHLLNLRGEVAVHEAGHEVEVEDLPCSDVADGRDEGDLDAAGEGAAERDLPAESAVAIAADAEVDYQERGHHDGVAESHAVADADLVGEEKRSSHKDGDDEAGDEPESKDGFLHVRLLVHVWMHILRWNRAGCHHPFG